MAIYVMNKKVNEIKESRSLTIDGIKALDVSIVEVEALDNFNNSFLFNSSYEYPIPEPPNSEVDYDPAIQDLINLYYMEISLETGATFTHPDLDTYATPNSINSYNKTTWDELLSNALKTNGDGIFYPFVAGADVSSSLENAGIAPNQVGDIIASVENKIDKVPTATENRIAIFNNDGGIKPHEKTIEEIVIESIGLENATQLEAETGLTNGVAGNEPISRLWSPEKINTAVQKLGHYTHNQDAASKLWVINHNLGKFPSVTTIENTNNQETLGKVIYNSIDEVQVEFSVEVMGTAYLN